MDRCLINLSNHPQSQWDSNQLQAASLYGEIIDIPFPSVDANADDDDIEILADELFEKIMVIAKDRAITVHIMGELTLTFLIVKKLQDADITCIASTSKRIVTEKAPGIKENVVFQFTRFRKYHKL